MSIIILLVAFGAMYAFLIVPNQRRLKQHEALVRSLEVGDEVLTSSGIFGTIVDFEGDSDEIMRLEVSDGVVVSMSRTSVTEVAVEIDESEDSED